MKTKDHDSVGWGLLSDDADLWQWETIVQRWGQTALLSVPSEVAGHAENDPNCPHWRLPSTGLKHTPLPLFLCPVWVLPVPNSLISATWETSDRHAGDQTAPIYTNIQMKGFHSERPCWQLFALFLPWRDKVGKRLQKVNWSQGCRKQFIQLGKMKSILVQPTVCVMKKLVKNMFNNNTLTLNLKIYRKCFHSIAQLFSRKKHKFYIPHCNFPASPEAPLHLPKFKT